MTLLKAVINIDWFREVLSNMIWRLENNTLREPIKSLSQLHIQELIKVCLWYFLQEATIKNNLICSMIQIDKIVILAKYFALQKRMFYRQSGVFFS